MEKYNEFFGFFAKNLNLSLNSNFFETGLFNFLVLIEILIFTGKDFLDPLLKKRKANILNNIENAENRLAQSKKRLYDVNKRLNQISIILNEIKTEAIKAKTAFLKIELIETRKSLKLYFNQALENYKLEKKQIFLDVKQQILLLALNKIINKIIGTFNKSDKVAKLINETIFNLKEDLL